MANHKLWGGRFEASLEDWVEEFGASIGFDYRLAPYDLQGSLAHVKMLGQTGILTQEEAKAIEAGLETLLARCQAGELTFDVQNEDIHMNMEALLTEEIGPVAGKLHTARSRNDQVATDMHLSLSQGSLATDWTKAMASPSGLSKPCRRACRDHYAWLYPSATRTTDQFCPSSSGLLPNVHKG